MMAATGTRTGSRRAQPPSAALPYRFAVADLERMVDAGILHEDDRVELLSGQVVTMAPIGEAHAAAVDQVAAALFEVARGRATVRVQGPLAIASDTQVQPDVAVIARGRVASGTVRAGASIHLIVEVADSSLAYDRSVKLAVYARAGVAEAWLLNLVGTPPGAPVARRRGEVEAPILEVYRDPDQDSGTYRSVAVFGMAEANAGVAVEPMAFPDQPVPVASLLPLGDDVP
jgi:hypothetical protein